MKRPVQPLTHTWIWGAIDAVARQRGLSPSGLARLAGLDPTAFNRSKRFTPEGRPRWPSTESLSKLLVATGMSLDAFAAVEVELGLQAAAGQLDAQATAHGPDSGGEAAMETAVQRRGAARLSR